jgi:hypothetical protein
MNRIHAFHQSTCVSLNCSSPTVSIVYSCLGCNDLPEARCTGCGPICFCRRAFYFRSSHSLCPQRLRLSWETIILKPLYYEFRHKFTLSKSASFCQGVVFFTSRKTIHLLARIQHFILRHLLPDRSGFFIDYPATSGGRLPYPGSDRAPRA